MAKKDLELGISADPEQAIQGLSKIIDKQEVMINKLSKMNRESQQTTKTMDAGFKTVASTIGLLGLPAAFIKGIKDIVAEFEKAAQLQKEMYGTAATTEQQIIKIAHLRGDVSRESLKAVRQEVEEIAKQTAVSMEVASKAFFFAESGMGAKTPAARTAAKAIAKFAAPAALTPEEVSQLPKLFKAWGAGTPEAQFKLLGQLQKATALSIAETGPYLQAFMEPMVTGRVMGFKFSELLALMTAAVEATGGVEEAATAVSGTLLISRGKTKRGLEYLTEQARKRGVDFSKLEAPERLGFTRDLYQELEKQGPAALDLFVTRVGGKGFKYLQEMFGQVGEQKFREVQPEIESATGELIQAMADQYLTTISAITEQIKRRSQISAARIGEEKEPITVLEEMAKDILEKAKAGAKRWETIGFGLTPGFLGMERRSAEFLLIHENLRLALEQEPEGTQRRRELERLQEYIPAQYLWGIGGLGPAYRWEPEYVEKVYRATKGFTLSEKYKRYMGTTAGHGPEYTAYTRGYKTYFGISDRDPQQEEILKEQITTNKLLEKFITEITRPDAALRMIGLNTGLID